LGAAPERRLTARQRKEAGMIDAPVTNLREPRTEGGFPRETEEGRSGRILVDAGGLVELSRRDRDTLLQELCFAAGSESLRELFEAAGEARPVTLDDERRSQLRAILEAWARDGVPPDGLMRLLAALARP
jgi:hypothetical protein